MSSSYCSIAVSSCSLFVFVNKWSSHRWSSLKIFVVYGINSNMFCDMLNFGYEWDIIGIHWIVSDAGVVVQFLSGARVSVKRKLNKRGVVHFPSWQLLSAHCFFKRRRPFDNLFSICTYNICTYFCCHVPYISKCRDMMDLDTMFEFHRCSSTFTILIHV